MINKEHLSLQGIRDIVSIKASMNWGLSEKLKTAFPGIIPLERPNVKLPTYIDPNWLVGFSEAEGSFHISIYESPTKTGYGLTLKFQITQHFRDADLMKALVSIFGCGNYKKRSPGTIGDFVVTKFSDITDKIIPLFIQYPLMGCKLVNFNKFCQVADLMKVKAHLTQDGLDKIRQIINL